MSIEKCLLPVKLCQLNCNMPFFTDCVQVMGSYCDVIVMRHPETGAIQVRLLDFYLFKPQFERNVHVSTAALRGDMPISGEFYVITQVKTILL